MRVFYTTTRRFRLAILPLGVIIGRTSEFFGFFVYGIASVLVFPRLVFGFVADPLTATFYSFAVFALAFLARPVGSVVFMWVDRTYGRGTKLTIALFLLGGSTASIAFLPGYATVGIWSVLLLSLFRLGQGFALGGVWDGLASLLALNAPANRRGWYAMIPQLGAPLGFALASGLFGYFYVNLSDADFLSWGWRYPFFVAFAVNVVALFARLRLVASKEFGSALDRDELQAAPVLETMRIHGRDVLLGAFVPLASFRDVPPGDDFPAELGLSQRRPVGGRFPVRADCRCGRRRRNHRSVRAAGGPDRSARAASDRRHRHRCLQLRRSILAGSGRGVRRMPSLSSASAFSASPSVRRQGPFRSASPGPIATRAPLLPPIWPGWSEPASPRWSPWALQASSASSSSAVI